MKPFHKKILLFFVLVFSLSLVWEVSHSVLYDWNKSPLQNSVQFYVPKILYSTFGDLVLLTAIFAVASLKRMNFKWIENPKKMDYLNVAVLGLVIAFLIEFRAEIQGSWAYNSFMPTIYGIGISPVLQLAITGILILWLVAKN
jgi:hypothetical protein